MSGYFPYQQGWLGADGAYSIPIGAGQSLWIFADTFVGLSTAATRAQLNGFIHNTIAISTCNGPNCSFQYYWAGMGTANQGPVFTSGWAAAEPLYTYPEMQPANANYTPNVFCYADKEHVEFETAGQLFFTYACNSTVVSDVTNNMGLYHPVVVTQTLPDR
jgi:hypothetical protein